MDPSEVLRWEGDGDDHGGGEMMLAAGRDDSTAIVDFGDDDIIDRSVNNVDIFVFERFLIEELLQDIQD